MGRKNGNRYWQHSKASDQEPEHNQLAPQKDRPNRRRRARGDVKQGAVRDAYASA